MCFFSIHQFYLYAIIIVCLCESQPTIHNECVFAPAPDAHSMASAIAPVTCTDVGSIQIRYGGRRLKLETVKKKTTNKYILLSCAGFTVPQYSTSATNVEKHAKIYNLILLIKYYLYSLNIFMYFFFCLSAE